MTLKLALVACLGFGAFAQTAPQVQTPAQVSADSTTLAIYAVLLRQMDASERLSAQAEAMKKGPPVKGRSWLQLQTGLTDQEYARVRPVMLDAISTTKAKMAEAEAAITQARKDNGVPEGPFTLTAAQKHAIGALNSEREQIIIAHVQQIAATLGPDRFQQFDNAVRSLIGPGVKIIPLRK